MAERELSPEKKSPPYFEKGDFPEEYAEEGSRIIGPLAPYVISGGLNTERWYFTHINDTTDYKLNITPKYFRDEANYTEAFPMRIKKILDKNPDAKIFCVFDWDTIYNDESQDHKLLKKHLAFEKEFSEEIMSGNLVLCPSMPSIEYWFLLHFEDTDILMKNFGRVAGRLAPYMRKLLPYNDKKFSKIIKGEKYLKDSHWVESLCAEGKLENACKRAQAYISKACINGNLEDHSYSYVYKIFKKG